MIINLAIKILHNLIIFLFQLIIVKIMLAQRFKKIFAFTHAKKIQSPRFQYPFDFTNNPQKFEMYDARFYEQPITLKLYEKQKQHIKFVISHFQDFLNTGHLENYSSKFVHPLLIDKTFKFREMLKTYNIKAQFLIGQQKIEQTEGYLEYHGIDSLLTGQDKFVQDFEIKRENEQVILREKVKDKEEKDDDFEKQLSKIGKSDSEKMAEENIEKMKKKILGGTQDRIKKAVGMAENINRMIHGDNSTKKFQKFYYVDRIHSTLITNYQYTDRQTQSLQRISLSSLLVTKWMYLVDSFESEDIRQSRKRTLFDFQLWNRGFFIPNKQYFEGRI